MSVQVVKAQSARSDEAIFSPEGSGWTCINSHVWWKIAGAEDSGLFLSLPRDPEKPPPGAVTSGNLLVFDAHGGAYFEIEGAAVPQPGEAGTFQ